MFLAKNQRFEGVYRDAGSIEQVEAVLDKINEGKYKLVDMFQASYLGPPLAIYS